jgi:signal transduction histidine kinase
MQLSLPSSLRTRLLLAVGVLAVAAVLAVAVTARQSTRQEFRRFRELDRISAPSHLAPLTASVAAVLSHRCCAADVLAEAATRLGPREAIVVVDPSGPRTLATAGPALAGLRDLDVRVDGSTVLLDAVRVTNATAEGLSLHLKGGPTETIQTADGRTAEVRVLAFPQPQEPQDMPAAAFLGSLDQRLLIAATMVGVLALAATWILTRRIAGPIVELSEATRDLTAGNLSRRVTARGADEIAALARSFNRMAAGLEHQETLRRNLVSDVAHELRTPLTALRCRLESIIDGVAEDPQRALSGANEEVRHLSRLVDDLQELALAEAGELALSIGPLPVADLVVSAARAADLETDPRFRVDVPAGLIVRGDAVRVRQVLVNLMTNAHRHTPRDGRITVTATARADEAHVEIHNTGSALTEEQLARVFDRFYRADPARQRETGGTGLGLAIVKHLVEAQNGRVWSRSTGSGQNTAVTFGFSLPCAQAVPAHGKPFDSPAR